MGGVPRTFKEIVAVSTVSKKEIGRCFKLILKAHDTNVEIITTGDFMNRFCGTLGLARDIQRAATTIAKRAVDLDLVPGRSPFQLLLQPFTWLHRLRVTRNLNGKFPIL